MWCALLTGAVVSDAVLISATSPLLAQLELWHTRSLDVAMPRDERCTFGGAAAVGEFANVHIAGSMVTLSPVSSASSRESAS